MSTYTHQESAAPLARSSSFFGTIKNIVSAPFTWFAGSEDEFEGAKGKRRRLPVIQEDAHMEDESLPSRAKRMRVSSPGRDSQPYLDPPGSAFTQLRRASENFTSGPVRDITRSPRRALHILSASNQSPRNRRTASPLPSSSRLKPEGVTRTMSLDPPSRANLSSRIQAAPSITDLQSEPSRPRSPTSAVRDVSMSPRHLRVRSSLTPQPSGTGFGPVVPPRRERGLDEPPPLAALMSNPMFVKPPPGTQKQSVAEPPKQLTLGNLVEFQRSARAPARQSSILFGTGSMTDVSARHLWPVNKAEIALHELEVYKTPLLPTRLKGATAVPDMFLHREKKHITLMTDDRPVKPRLGTKSKGKERGKKQERERRTINGTKPYAGEGGMKKWLARHKKEEEEEKEKERAEAMEDERAEEEKKRKEAEAEQRKREEELKVPPPPPAPAFEPRASCEGPSRSSLRVGRTRMGRNHLERPVSRRAKFSAAFEDEDEEMEESRTAEQKALEEAAKKVPVFELPATFTFAKEAGTAITDDLSHTKELPITSLPFSLTKPAPAPVVTVPPAETLKVAPVPPTLSLVPPTPEPVRVTPPEASSTAAPASSVVPNFFANSSILAKAAPVMTLPSASIVSSVERPKLTEVPEPTMAKPAGATPSLFAAPSQPASVFAPPDSLAPPSTVGAPLATSKEAEKPTMPTTSLASPFTFGAPTKLVKPAPDSTPTLPPEQTPAAEPAKPAAPSNGAPFTFGAPPSALSPAPVPAASLTPITSVTGTGAPKSVFAFDQPAPVVATSASAAAPVIATPTTDTSKPLFGAPSTTPFSFGQRPSTIPAEEKPATTPFSFATATTAEKKPTTGFTFAPSTALTAPTAAPAPFAFGATPSGTTVADVSNKSFTFGATAPTRPATPPKAVQEVTMDESPARDVPVNGNNKAPERPTLNFSFNTPSGSALFAQSPATTLAPFSFGASGATVNPFAKEEKKETKPAVPFGGFGQAASSGFSFGQKPGEGPATTAPAAVPFQFAQPSPNATPASPFTFGPTPPTGFGQPSVASAPSSPSLNRPGPFSFMPPTTTQPGTTPFTFGTGSQPASPATGNTNLPSTTTGSTPFTFGAGAGAAAPSATGFGAPSSAAATSLFTIGSAPPPVEGAGARRIKGLPRRGARR